ncbi:MAG: DUF6290 family protein [Chthoniobacteraceae bacterium]
MFTIRLNVDIEKRLERLAKKTGRTGTAHVRQAILEHLENLEDVQLVAQRLQKPSKTYSVGEVKREFGF